MLKQQALIYKAPSAVVPKTVKNTPNRRKLRLPLPKNALVYNICILASRSLIEKRGIQHIGNDLHSVTRKTGSVAGAKTLEQLDQRDLLLM